MKFANSRFKKKEEAKIFYYEMIEQKCPYVCLLFSSDYWSEGYWVESSPPKNLIGQILLTHDITIIRDKKIEEIII